MKNELDFKNPKIYENDSHQINLNPTILTDKLLEDEKNMNDYETDSNHNFPDVDNSQRSFFKRVFSPIIPGSIRSGIFTMSILSLGTACLALPKKFANMGILVGLINIIIAGLSAYLTLKLLSISATKHKIYEYSKLVKKVIGKRSGDILDISILIYIFGILILYNVISKIIFKLKKFLVYKLIGSIVYDIGQYYNEYSLLDDFINKSFWSENTFKFPIMFGIGIFVIIPLCLLKDISKMSFSSIMGVCTLFSLVLIIIFEFPCYYQYYLKNDRKENDPETWINFWDVKKGFTEKLYFFRGMSTLFYAYSCHIAAFPIYKCMKDKSALRIQKIYRRSIMIDGFFYFVVGTVGYLTMPINTPDLIIQRKKIFTNDIVMTIGRIAFFFTLLSKVPVNYNSYRISFCEIFFRNSEISDKK